MKKGHFPKFRCIILSSAVVLTSLAGCASTPQTKTVVSLAMANYFNSWLSTYAIREKIVTSDTVDVNITLAVDYETQVLAGKFPMGAMATAKFAFACETSEIDFRAISTYIIHEGAEKQEGVNILYALAGSSISSPTDLVGKKVGVPDLTSSATSVFLGMLKQDFGIEESQLTLIDKQNPLLLELMRQGEVDVAMLGGNVSVEAFVDPAFKVVWNLDKAFYAKYGDYFFPSILIVQDRYLKDNPGAVRTVYGLLEESNRYGEEHLSELAAKYAAEYGQGQTSEFYIMVYNEHSRTRMTPIEGKTRDILMATFALVKERGIISSVPNPDEIFAAW
jgi:ABC-type nitrate/sulfonate/bicarbonate transport system substrate-binding protein